MRNSISAAVSLFVLTACNVPQAGFENMTEQELYEYNASVGNLDKVFCVDEIRTGSHINARHCASYGDVLEGNVSRLKTPSSSISTTYAH